MDATHVDEISYWLKLAFFIVASVCLPYLAMKGKNQATKEDIQGITKDIESVKSEFAQLLNINNYRYQKEFDSLMNLMRDVVKFKRVSSDFVVHLSTYDTTSQSETHRQISDKWADQYEKLMCNTEINKPFYPDDIYLLILKFEKVVSTTAHKARVVSRIQGDKALEYYNDIERLRMETDKLYEEIGKAVKLRVSKWECTEKKAL